MELIIRFVGYGLRCNNCGRMRNTTRYQLKEDGTVFKEFLLCDECQDQGYTLRFRKPEPPTRDKSSLQRQVKISRKMEAELARDIDGKRQPGSGNGDAKGDVRKIGQWRLEHKFTDGVYGYQLKVKDLSTIIRHANMAGEWPALVVAFRQLKRKFAVIPYEVFIEIVEKLSETFSIDRRPKRVQPKPAEGGVLKFKD